MLTNPLDFHVSVFATLIAKAQEAELPFIIIGGHAVIAYGYPRQTSDFDLLVESRHRFRWDQLVRDLGYSVKHAHTVFHMYESEVPAHQAFDLMLVDQGTFANFAKEAVAATVEGVPVQIPTLLHLVALKLHAEKCGGERRLGRDYNDVLMLLKLNHVELADPALQEILERYGDERTRSQLRIAFGKS